MVSKRLLILVCLGRFLALSLKPMTTFSAYLKPTSYKVFEPGLFFSTSFSSPHRKGFVCKRITNNVPVRTKTGNGSHYNSNPNSVTSTYEDESPHIFNHHTNNNQNSNQNVFLGKRKWLGGAITNDKTTIYGIPAHAHSVLRIHINHQPTYEKIPKFEKKKLIDSSIKQHSPAEEMKQMVTENVKVSIDTIPLPTRFQKRRFKWLRGILVGDYLFGIPSWSSAGVLRVNVHPEYLPNQIKNQTLISDGMRLETEEDRVNVLPLPLQSTEQKEKMEDENAQYANRWLWHGAVLVTDPPSNPEHSESDEKEEYEKNIRIYCIPANANRVLKVTSASIYTKNNSHENYSTSYIGPNLSNQCNKWYGGILGYDQAVYGIPYAAGSILRIDTQKDANNNVNNISSKHVENENENVIENNNDEVVQLLGDFGKGKYNWHGGVLSPINGAIYAFPSHADTVLKIDTTQNGKWTKLPIHVQQPSPPENNMINSDNLNKFETKNNRNELLQMKYKWLGGAIGMDGAIYGMPSDCACILRIDPSTDECTTFGESILSELTEACGYSIRHLKNKWQGGVLAPRDGCIYAIPSDAECVLKINTNPLKEGEVDDGRISLLDIDGDFMTDKKVTDKWQGGFLGVDGNIYAIPENADRLLRVVVGDAQKESYLELL